MKAAIEILKMRRNEIALRELGSTQRIELSLIERLINDLESADRAHADLIAKL